MADVIIGGILLMLFVLACRSIYKQAKSGGCSSCGCKQCSHCNACKQEKTSKKQ